VTVPTLVPQGQVKRALAMDSVSYNLGRALAPAFGVFVLVTSIRRAASALCVLSVAMMIFVLAPVFWLSVAAALVAGMACLHAGATLKALLRPTFGKRLVRNIAFERAS
jgi:hypothetical protein